MDFGFFTEGLLLRVVLCFFSIGILFRVVFSLISIFRNSRYKDHRQIHVPASILQSVLPFHRGIAKRPGSVILFYVFHICLIVVPVWYSGHIRLWQESIFGWRWPELPDRWIDWMTLLFLGLSTYFFVQILIAKDNGGKSFKSDYFLICVTVLPFASGYLLAHGNLDSIAFLEESMRVIHVLSGEALIVVVVFVFMVTRLNRDKCTGCASCEISCPTGALKSIDEKDQRIFGYSPYQCVYCGACINVCPENAAELRHEIGFKAFFRPGSRKKIGVVKLSTCKGCGTSFAPVPQLAKVSQMLAQDYLAFCNTCRENLLIEPDLRQT